MEVRREALNTRPIGAGTAGDNIADNARVRACHRAIASTDGKVERRNRELGCSRHRVQRWILKVVAARADWAKLAEQR